MRVSLRIKFKIREILVKIEGFFLRFKRKKDILLVIDNEIMFSYAHPMYEKLKEDKRLRLWCCFHMPHRFKEGNLLKIKKKYKVRSILPKIAVLLRWDLIIFPNHVILEFRQRCPKIYIGHGLLAHKLINGFVNKYGPSSRIGDKAMRYDKIFAPSFREKEIVEKYYPDHFSSVRVVGNLIVDELITMKSQRENILKENCLNPDRLTILFVSSWGPYSLAEKEGLRFLSNIKDFLKKYNIIFSIHPNNFVPEDAQSVDWTQELKKINYENLCVLRNNEAVFQFLPAVDVLVTDHTSSGLFFPAFGKPIISYVNSNIEFGPGSLTLELQKVSYNIRDIDNLKQDIETAIKQFNKEDMDEFSSTICSYLGKAWERYEEEIYDLLSNTRFSADELMDHELIK